MDIRRSFISTRKTRDTSSTIPDDDEEEYYMWRIRDLERKIRDTRKKIAKIKNIRGLSP